MHFVYKSGCLRKNVDLQYYIERFKSIAVQSISYVGKNFIKYQYHQIKKKIFFSLTIRIITEHILYRNLYNLFLIIFELIKVEITLTPFKKRIFFIYY